MGAFGRRVPPTYLSIHLQSITCTHRLNPTPNHTHAHTHARPHASVGFYGLDVYSLLESLESILNYLKEVDGEAAVASAVRRPSTDRLGLLLPIIFIHPPVQTPMPQTTKNRSAPCTASSAWPSRARRTWARATAWRPRSRPTAAVTRWWTFWSRCVIVLWCFVVVYSSSCSSRRSE